MATQKKCYLRFIPCRFVFWFLFILLTALPLYCAPVPRQQPAVGIIAGATGDAQIRFIQEQKWVQAPIDQDLVTGDNLRTGPLGSMALLFTDRTQIRIHRNSTLTIKAVARDKETGGSIFRLNRGGAWARSTRDDSNVRIETPSATAAIRGTDWSLQVDKSGMTTLIVLDGKVVFGNEFGQVFVSRGEIAVAEIGKAPSKMVMVAPDDRELIYYNMSLAQALGLISLTDMKTRERRENMNGLAAIPPEDRTPDQWLDLAELAYDINDRNMTRQCLKSARVEGNNSLTARADFIRGFLAVANLEFEKAQKVLASAEKRLDHGRRLTAMVGRAGSLLMNREMKSARDLIQQMSNENGTHPRFLEFQILLTAFAGDLPEASAMAKKYGQQFPDDVRFPSLESALAVLLARGAVAGSAAKRVLAIDPENAFGFFILGTWQSDFLLDREAAIKTFQEGLGFNEHDADLWGALGLAYSETNEMQLAEGALLKAISLSPKDIVFLCNYVFLLLDQSRMDEATGYIKQLVALEPSREITLILQGRQALQTDRMEPGRDFFLKATTVNPAMPMASLGLAIAYYQNGEQELAEQALASAGRLDPNNPEIPLVGATIALDQARADDAIEYAGQAIEKYRQIKGVGVAGLAANRGGKNTLGGAFMGLSLNSWADYYNEVSFDPYSADSHFYRAIQADDFSSMYQGLLLEPLAVSDRNRLMDFYRRPFTDFSVGGSMNWPDEGQGYAVSANVQGFDQSLLPLSYYLSFETADYPGNVENADATPISGLGMAGMNITPYDRVFVSLTGSDTDTGLPGTRSIPDLDDEMQVKTVLGEIGYAHSFGARNLFMGHVSITRTRSTIRNNDPFGTGLSAVDFSLISNFGPAATQLLYDT